MSKETSQTYPFRTLNDSPVLLGKAKKLLEKLGRQEFGGTVCCRQEKNRVGRWYAPEQGCKGCDCGVGEAVPPDFHTRDEDDAWFVPLHLREATDNDLFHWL